MTEPITLFSIVERVARLREAQKRCDELDSEYNRRQALPLMLEVDALLIRSQKILLHPDLEKFVNQVKAMREAQGQFGMVAKAEQLKLELEVDKAIGWHTLDAKLLNARLRKHNMPLEVPVMPNNTARKNKKGGVR